ncbi:serine hydrolase [Ginsengibacter hankyongi]|uniref:Serine hydrolase n=1 Tax=Ginsengibacter hankyongi TaxID=2607284 RepID=A0A5J5IIA3_9BACT|nr:serine hydrolase [Ginsengibacter hankyongi]KAA9040646.1 serine hydrolase [Ginsengibacter hankyongi]
MKKIAFIICFSLSIIVSFAQQPSFITDSIDGYINSGMKQWNVPGLAIVIVKDGKVVLMKGYGVRDIKTNEPVDENTLFMIASNSKLFTATSLAQLEYDKKLSLDDKITKYFPTYRVYDSTTTQLVTIRDMLSHHLGTKTFQGDFTFWNRTLSSAEIMNKMRLLKPSQNFRQSFGYCNSCFLTAGEVIQKVTGKPWAVYVTDSILQPLDMANTHALGMGMSQMPDASKPYTNNFTGEITELPYDDVDNLAPAGSIVSCVKDISHWLLLQLDSGKYDGRQIIPWQVLQRTRQMQTIISSTKSQILPRHYYGYGLGNFQGDYNGRQEYEHTGGADGFVTNVCFVPEENLGISILTNNDNQDFFEALRYQILDAYLGVKYVSRDNQFYQFFKPEFNATVKKVKDLQARVKGNRPTRELKTYVGKYNNELFGEVTITQQKNDLLLHFSHTQNLTATLQYMDNDEWLLTYSNPAFGIFPLKFKTTNGKLSMDVKVNDFLEFDPYTFVKE